MSGSTGKPINVTFTGTLRDKQPDAVTKLLKHDEGVLCAGTAFGKTVAAAFVIAARRTNTLVLVHRAQLLDQWRERLAAFLDLSIDSIGQIGAERTRPLASLTSPSSKACIEKARSRIWSPSTATSLWTNVIISRPFLSSR
jgi:superfamily II DNA or RNA helicase